MTSTGTRRGQRRQPAETTTPPDIGLMSDDFQGDLRRQRAGRRPKRVQNWDNARNLLESRGPQTSVQCLVVPAKCTEQPHNVGRSGKCETPTPRRACRGARRLAVALVRRRVALRSQRQGLRPNPPTRERRGRRTHKPTVPFDRDEPHDRDAIGRPVGGSQGLATPKFVASGRPR